MCRSRMMVVMSSRVPGSMSIQVLKQLMSTPRTFLPGTLRMYVHGSRRQSCTSCFTAVFST